MSELRDYEGMLDEDGAPLVLEPWAPGPSRRRKSADVTVAERLVSKYMSKRASRQPSPAERWQAKPIGPGDDGINWGMWATDVLSNPRVAWSGGKPYDPNYDVMFMAEFRRPVSLVADERTARAVGSPPGGAWPSPWTGHVMFSVQSSSGWQWHGDHMKLRMTVVWTIGVYAYSQWDVVLLFRHQSGLCPILTPPPGVVWASADGGRQHWAPWRSVRENYPPHQEAFLKRLDRPVMTFNDIEQVQRLRNKRGTTF